MAKRTPVTRRVKTDAELEAEHQAAMVDRFIVGPDGTAQPAPTSTDDAAEAPPAPPRPNR